MTKWQGLDRFWNSFGIPAYDQNTVPPDAQMPYITYEAVTAGFEDVTPLAGYIWYRSTSWQEASEKADQIAGAINPYRLVQLGNKEYLFIAKGIPFAQRVSDENDSVRRIYINLMAEYFSAT